jgi:hypothetical protein
MAALPDELKLCDIAAIPGTHNSGAVNGGHLMWGWAKCQSASLRAQLDMGIRRLDFRLCDTVAGGKVFVSHRFPSRLSFHSCLRHIKDFLDDNPSECVFVCIKRDWDLRRHWNSGRKTLDLLNASGLRFAVYPPYTEEVCTSTTLLPMQQPFGAMRLQALRGCVFISSQDGHMWKGSDGESLEWQVPGKINLDFGFCDMWEMGSLACCQSAILRSAASHREPETVAGFSTNLVLGIIMPRHVAWRMNEWLKSRCGSGEWNGRKLGFVVVDFAQPSLVQAILQLNFTLVRC